MISIIILANVAYIAIWSLIITFFIWVIYSLIDYLIYRYSKRFKIIKMYFALMNKDYLINLILKNIDLKYYTVEDAFVDIQIERLYNIIHSKMINSGFKVSLKDVKRVVSNELSKAKNFFIEDTIRDYFQKYK